MEVQKFDDFLNEAFGSKETSYGIKVKRCLHDIISNVKGISEKSFKQVDELKKRIDDAFTYNPEIDETIRRYEQKKSRVEYCAEHVYDWFIKGTDVEKNI